MLLYGSYEEKGYTFEAYIPNDDTEPVAFELRILIGADPKYVFLIPMTYTPTFGVDGGDRQNLEAVLDRVLVILPDAHEFGAEDALALDKLDIEIGGKKALARHQRWLNSPGRVSGQFDYTADLFAAKFADAMGGRDAMDRWMKTKIPQFGDHTPEEALHLGMTQTVIDHLLQLTRQKSTDSTED